MRIYWIAQRKQYLHWRTAYYWMQCRKGIVFLKKMWLLYSTLRCAFSTARVTIDAVIASPLDIPNLFKNIDRLSEMKIRIKLSRMDKWNQNLGHLDVQHDHVTDYQYVWIHDVPFRWCVNHQIVIPLHDVFAIHFKATTSISSPSTALARLAAISDSKLPPKTISVPRPAILVCNSYGTWAPSFSNDLASCSWNLAFNTWCFIPVSLTN